MNKWNRKNALRMLLYAILYAAVSAVVCFTGAIHPVLFVCYQITAGILLSGILIRGFGRIKAPGVAACLDQGKDRKKKKRRTKKKREGSGSLRKISSVTIYPEGDWPPSEYASGGSQARSAE